MKVFWREKSVWEFFFSKRKKYLKFIAFQKKKSIFIPNVSMKYAKLITKEFFSNSILYSIIEFILNSFQLKFENGAFKNRRWNIKFSFFVNVIFSHLEENKLQMRIMAHMKHNEWNEQFESFNFIFNSKRDFFFVDVQNTFFILVNFIAIIIIAA